QRWTKSVSVPLTTLDELIDKHGVPAFIKIDVEGFEAEVLAGLTHVVNALSFEFTTIQRDVALACVERCIAMGYTRFNAALGESQNFVNADWVGGEEIARWLTGLPYAANSGDVYAALRCPQAREGVALFSCARRAGRGGLRLDAMDILSNHHDVRRYFRIRLTSLVHVGRF